MVQRNAGEALRAEAKALKEVARALAELKGMNLSELRARYLELFGEVAKSKNLPFLRKKLAYRIQERVEGGLSPFAKQRIAELGSTDLPEKPEKPVRRTPVVAVVPESILRDPRLPAAGTLLVREHGGFEHAVEVLDSGFSYRGRSYRSLSAIAKEITGTAWNGFLFFGLTPRKAGHGR